MLPVELFVITWLPSYAEEFSKPVDCEKISFEFYDPHMPACV